METICRICLKVNTNNEYLPFAFPTGFPCLRTIKEVLRHTIPEMNVYLTIDPYICSTCWDNISQFYKLKLECLQNETKFLEYSVKCCWQDSFREFVIKECKVKQEESVPVDRPDPDTISIIKHELITSVRKENYLEDDVDSSQDEYNLLCQQLEKENCDQTIVNLLSDKEGSQQGTTQAKKKRREQEKALECSLCLTECIDKAEAACHAIEFHGVHIVICCKLCNKFFVDNLSFEEHLKMHTAELTCQFCGLIFVNIYSLSGHIRKAHHELLVFNCQYCSMVFNNKKEYIKHKKKLHLKTLYTCDICGRSHATNVLLQEHRLIHSTHKRYMCEKCGDRFKQKSVLYLHNVKKHLKRKTKQCPHCPKKFLNNHVLSLHQVVHTGEKKFQCPICSKRFSQKASVDRHLTIHSGTKFSCNICGRAYSQMYDLKKHVCIPGVTTRVRRSRIDVKSTETDNSLKYSSSKSPIEGIAAACEICKNVYKKSYIKMHMRTHTGEKPEMCEICGKSFSQTASLTRHMMTHTGEKQYKCDKCDSSFIQKVDLQVHVRRKHTGERPYECKVCNMRFIELSVLLRHKRTLRHKLVVEKEESIVNNVVAK